MGIVNFVEDLEYFISEWLLLISIYKAKPPTPDKISSGLANLWKSLYKNNKHFHLKFNYLLDDSVEAQSGNNLEKVLIKWADPKIGLLDIIVPDEKSSEYHKLHYHTPDHRGCYLKDWKEVDHRYILSGKGLRLLKDSFQKIRHIVLPLNKVLDDNDL